VLTLIKMLLVFALLGGTLWWLRRHDKGAMRTARRGERPVAVVGQTRVGKTASVALVRIGELTYAVGVTEQSVSLLVPEPVELPELEPVRDATSPGDAAGPGAPSAPAGPAGRTTPPTVREFLGGLLGRRRRVEYLDVALPAPRSLAADGSARDHLARTPEPSIRR
jgi:flagellar biogenesis protein FliO